MNKSRLLGAFVPLFCCACLSVPTITYAISFSGLDYLSTSSQYSRAYGISSDGTVIVGGSTIASSGPSYAVRWTSVNSPESLESFSGSGSTAYATSSDGSVVTGNDFAGAGPVAFRWTQNTGMVNLGTLSGARNSQALDISADGSVIVGGGSGEAWRWTESTGIVGLGGLSGGILDGAAEGVSADGLVVVGSDVSSSGREAFRWTESTGMVGLGDLTGGVFASFASGTNSDGSIIVGSSVTDTGYQAYRWDNLTGMVGLDFLHGMTRSAANATSLDGSVIAGYSLFGGWETSQATLWDNKKGVRLIADILTSSGVDLAGWQLINAHDISGDGSIIVGHGINPDGYQQAWVADISTIPIPPAVWLFGSGLLGLVGMARRKKAA